MLNTAFHMQRRGLEEGTGLILSWATKDHFTIEVTPWRVPVGEMRLGAKTAVLQG